MWTHPAWPGRFLPQPLAAAERLRAYASWCNAVEGNTTFYAIPSAAAVDSWVQQTDPDFRFVLKLPKSITHERRLVDADQELRSFLQAIEPLGPRVHTLWIQLPASFAPGDVETLVSFLRRLPHSHRYAVEVRHIEFFINPRSELALEEALSGVDAEWIPFDTSVFFEHPPTSNAERDAWSKKPRVPRRPFALTDRPVIRYLGRDDPNRTVVGWRPWVETVTQWLHEGRSPTFFVHTPDNVDALALARRFHDEVRAQLPVLTPLPEPTPVGPPTLF